MGTNDPMDLYNQKRAERLRNTLPTRDDLMKPTLSNYNRRQAEDAERVANHRRSQAIDLLRRTLGREPSEGEINDALQR